MINDVDQTLEEIVRNDVLNGANVEVSFEAPSKDWAARRSGPALNFYLYDITEDMSLRDRSVKEIRNDQGRVVDRRTADRRFRLAYLVTAWTQRPQDEHRLLASVLSCFLALEALPANRLQGTLPDADGPLRVTVGLPLPKDRQLSDIWSALGGELKASLDLVVTAPFPVGKTFEVGKLVTEPPVLGIRGADNQHERVTQAAAKDPVEESNGHRRESTRIRRLRE